MRRITLALAVASVGCAGAAPPPPEPAPQITGPQQAFTRVALHPDDHARRLYSVNYLQAGLIPICSQVSVLDVNEMRMVFVVNETGRKYEYLFHPKMRESPESNLALYFGPECDAPPPQEFSEVERQGIATGQVLPGMSKRAVVLAAGYPPSHATPSLEADQWIYWRNRFNRVAVVFVGGRVQTVRE